ncbi:MAG: DUF4301 family protein [Bacteroidota bacterium]
MILSSPFVDRDLAERQIPRDTLEIAQGQIEALHNGGSYLEIVRSATVKDGIVRLTEEQATYYQQLFEALRAKKSILKFIPASGIGSRMFSELYSYLNELQTPPALTHTESNHRNGSQRVSSFLENIHEFAFAPNLEQSLGEPLSQAIRKGRIRDILEHLLTERGLNYGQLPKGLLPFHEYQGVSRTPFEEHLIEAAQYATDADGKVHLTFTVSPTQLEKFQSLLAKVKDTYEKSFGVSYQIQFSPQKESTYRMMVSMDHEIIRDEEGKVALQAGGHGSLLENLNEVEADIIFIKNIDNVIPDPLKQANYTYKKVLAGILLELQERTFDLLREAEKHIYPEASWIEHTTHLLEQELGFRPPDDFHALAPEEKTTYLIRKLNRPIRVCGMVKDHGEPGGSPYWALQSDGSTSLQIVEHEQVDWKDEKQNLICQASTHFNPVDIVCGTNDFRGNSFNLLNFRDVQAGFISQKSINGKEVKSYELPGLWNGGMADWNTLFVEVPRITFHPVKTIFDLLNQKEYHS